MVHVALQPELNEQMKDATVADIAALMTLKILHDLQTGDENASDSVSIEVLPNTHSRLSGARTHLGTVPHAAAMCCCSLRSRTLLPASRSTAHKPCFRLHVSRTPFGTWVRSASPCPGVFRSIRAGRPVDAVGSDSGHGAAGAVAITHRYGSLAVQRPSTSAYFLGFVSVDWECYVLVAAVQICERTPSSSSWSCLRSTPTR